MANETHGYYRHPTLHGDTVAFVCEDDLWAVSASGGVARRLTGSPGSVSFPRFSPDGSQLAYTATDEGPSEVFVMASSGGSGRRLTWLGAGTRTVGWTPDGTRVLLQSNAGRPFARDYHLHAVPAAGGPTERLPWGTAHEIAFEPGGPGVLLGRNSGDLARWKRYRGGTAGALWIDRRGDGRFARLAPFDGNVASPMWIGARIWFLSDHEGHGNLYSCTPGGRDLRRHTDHEGFYARFPSTDGRRIVYHAGADLYLHDVESDRGQRLEIMLGSARPGRRRRFVDVAENLETADLHPAGSSLACVARGGAFTLGLWEGAPLRHGEPSVARTRLARWLPDGERLVAVSDESGEEALVVLRADGSARPKTLAGDFGRFLDLEPAPGAGSERADRVAFSNHRQEVWIADLRAGSASRIAHSGHDRIAGLAWSPDGRWLAFGFPSTRRASSIHVYDTSSGATHEITRPEFADFAPSFDPGGKYLCFLSLRAFDPVYDSQYFDLGFPKGVVPCLVPLERSTPSPFDAAQRPAQRPRAKPPRPDEPAPGAKQPAVKIDFDGIADRVVAFPLPEGRYRRLVAGHGRVFLTSVPVEGSLDEDWRAKGPPKASAKLEVWDFDRDRAEMLLRAVTDVALSLDGHTLLVRVGNRLRALPASIESRDLSSREEVGRETGWVDLGRVRLEVVPEHEWRQMLREAWRLQRDQFWTSDMSRVDWKNALARYLPLVDRVATRSEFSDLVWEIQGELGTSHSYELGGDYLPSPAWHQGFLGADVEWDGKARAWVIRRIPRGDSWDAKARSPLAAPGLGVAAGDHLVAVAGQALSATRSPFELLVHQAGQPIRLTVRGKKGVKRQIAVTALANETPLRYRDWVDANRARVLAETGGRVGYLHIPDMGPHGYSEFHRAFRNEVDRDGLIVDVRWNGGGNVSQLLLEKLQRRPISYDVPRWQGPAAYPADAPRGPLVAVTNEHAGSDGDIFCHAWKIYRLGPLLGKRTWGGVIGIWPRHALVDGTITTQAEFSTWFVDVGWGVENYGTDPDIEVDVSPQDHVAGDDPQLDRAIREMKRLLRERKPGLPKLDRRPDLRAPKLGRERAAAKEVRVTAPASRPGAPAITAADTVAEGEDEQATESQRAAAVSPSRRGDAERRARRGRGRHS
jgi:tricorn protease